MPLSGIQIFSQEAGFPIRSASGMTVVGICRRLELFRKENDHRNMSCEVFLSGRDLEIEDDRK
jgi:hypothetical protein